MAWAALRAAENVRPLAMILDCWWFQAIQLPAYFLGTVGNDLVRELVMDAEDVLQEAAIKGFLAFESYDPSRPFKGWWFVINLD